MNVATATLAPLHFAWWPRSEYGAALDAMRRLHADVAGGAPDALVLTEHRPAVTLGRHTPPDLALALETATARDWPVFRVERGGSVTVHGPGQLVAYPVVRLREDERDLHRFVSALEDAVIRLAAEYHVRLARRSGYPGCWAEDGRKVASVGVHVARWTTMHGIAVNVWGVPEPFRHVAPCGLPGVVATSIADLGGTVATREAAALRLARLVAARLGRELVGE